MSDRRTTAVNARVADARLPGVLPGVARIEGQVRQVQRSVVDLLRSPDGARDRQLLMGAAVTVFEDRDGWCFVQSQQDDYVGYVPTASVGPAQGATHWVHAAATHVYERADIKSPDLCSLSFGSRVRVLGDNGGWAETPLGFVPSIHLCPVGTVLADPVSVATLFLGTPYLWGGNSRSGIDCSGLVQAAMLACGHPCPADSDQQIATLGTELAPGTAPLRGDLLFWKGHVALVADEATILHANAHHMAVSFEPLDTALGRIPDPLLAHKRL
jgi:cell wall-associated NlpC family hydrolase